MVAADGNDGGHGIIVIDREVVEINYFLLYFIDSAKPFDSGLVQPLARGRVLVGSERMGRKMYMVMVVIGSLGQPQFLMCDVQCLISP